MKLLGRRAKMGNGWTGVIKAGGPLALGLMAAMAGCGLPGFANFVGEVTVFFGAWTVFPLITGLALWGALIVGAV